MHLNLLNNLQNTDSLNSLYENPGLAIVATLSAVTVLVFGRMAYLKGFQPTKDSPLLRKDSLSRVPTLLRNRTAGFNLASIKVRTNKFISDVLQKTVPEFPAGKIRGSLVWIKDLTHSLYVRIYRLFFHMAIKADLAKIQSLVLHVNDLEQVVTICKKHSHVLVDFALIQSLYSEMIPHSDEAELEKLTTSWEQKGFVISPKRGLDESYRPLLKSYRDCILFFAPYIHKDELQKQILILIDTIKTSLLKENPEKAVDFLSSFLKTLFIREPLQTTDPIFDALKGLVPLIPIKCGDRLYTTTIFPLLEKTGTDIPYTDKSKAREIVYRQITDPLFTPDALKWLIDPGLNFWHEDLTLVPLRPLLKQTAPPSLQQVLQALFFKNSDGVKEFLDQQMLVTFDHRPVLKRELLPRLVNWNEQQPTQIKPNTFLHRHYIRTDSQFILSFLAVSDQNIISFTKPIVLKIEDLKRELGDQFLDHPDLEKHLLQKASQAISETDAFFTALLSE